MLTMILSMFLACGTKEGDTAGGDVAAGETSYTNACATCHGADGMLGYVVNGVPAADLVFEIGDLSDAEITTVIMDGKGEMGAGFLTDEADIVNCIAYMRATF